MIDPSRASLDPRPPGRGSRRFEKTAALVVAAWTIGVLGLVLVEAVVPDAGVIAALERGEDRLEIEEREQPYDNAGTRIDEYSERFNLTVGIGEPRGATTLETLAMAANLGSCTTLVEQLNPHDADRASADGSLLC